MDTLVQTLDANLSFIHPTIVAKLNTDTDKIKFIEVIENLAYRFQEVFDKRTGLDKTELKEYMLEYEHFIRRTIAAVTRDMTQNSRRNYTVDSDDSGHKNFIDREIDVIIDTFRLHMEVFPELFLKATPKDVIAKKINWVCRRQNQQVREELAHIKRDAMNIEARLMRMDSILSVHPFSEVIYDNMPDIKAISETPYYGNYLRAAQILRFLRYPPNKALRVRYRNNNKENVRKDNCIYDNVYPLQGIADRDYIDEDVNPREIMKKISNFYVFRTQKLFNDFFSKDKDKKSDASRKIHKLTLQPTVAHRQTFKTAAESNSDLEGDDLELLLDLTTGGILDDYMVDESLTDFLLELPTFLKEQIFGYLIAADLKKRKKQMCEGADIRNTPDFVPEESHRVMFKTFNGVIFTEKFDLAIRYVINTRTGMGCTLNLHGSAIYNTTQEEPLEDPANCYSETKDTLQMGNPNHPTGKTKLYKVSRHRGNGQLFWEYVTDVNYVPGYQKVVQGPQQAFMQQLVVSAPS